MIYLLFSLIVTSALFKAIMDTLQFGARFRSIGPWWNPTESWKMKWKNGDKHQGERFPGSSTIFVSFTDAWHLFQHFFLMTLFLIPVVYTQVFPIIHWYWMIADYALIYASFTFTFQIIYWLLNE
jgi:hypothetical protein